MVNFGKQAIQSFSHFQQLESSLQGLMRSEEKGTELFEHLRSFSFDTTFGVDTLASASQQLLGVGIAVEDLDSTLMMMGNVAQGDTQKFMELVSVFAKIQNQGKASSIQLQQLALRGVPIYQMLKQMGIEGTATGEDIRKAFENMTSAGGQFEGAMERINNTIQGREGFVSDTWREFLTSFAEASGLADIYAKALDVVYNALQSIVDWLQKINENPVYQAVFRGVLVTMLGAIGSTLLLKLIPVIVTLTKSILTLTGVMTAFNATNPFGWVALAVSGIAGLTVAYKSLKKEAKEFSDVDKENMQRYTIEELMKQYSKDKSKMSDTDVLKLANWQVKYWEEQYKSKENSEREKVIAGEEWSKWQREATTRIIKINRQIKPDWYTEEPTVTPTETSEEVAQEEKINDLMKDRIKLFQDYLNEKQKIENRLALLGLEGEALLKLKYIQEGFTEEQAEVLASEQHKLDLLNEEIDKQKQLAEQAKREAEERAELERNAKYSLSGLQSLMKKDGNVAGYYGVELLQQTSAGSIVNGAMQGAEMGGMWGAIAGGLMSAVMQLDGFQKILTVVNKVVSWVLEPINWLFNKIAGWLGLEDEANEQKEKEIQRLKEVNEQYKSLSKAIDDQNQYYLALKQNLANETEKRLLNARGVTDVNDMIITPNGNFSTHPDDYIIASKNPSELGGSKVNITINNNAGVDVSAQKSQNGDITNLVLTISKKVAGDYASGANGWDNAVASRSRRVAGTSYSR